jgi:hypothetical protein
VLGAIARADHTEGLEQSVRELNDDVLLRHAGLRRRQAIERARPHHPGFGHVDEPELHACRVTRVLDDAG